MKKNKARQVKTCKRDLGKKIHGIPLDIENSKELVQAKVRDKLKSLRRQSLHQRITKENSSLKEQSRVTPNTKDEKGDYYSTEKPLWFLNHQYHWFHNQIATLFGK